MTALRIAVVVTLVLTQQAFAAPPDAARLRQACFEDAKRLCRQVKRGNGRVLRCLEHNTPQLSPACRAILTARGKG